MEWLYILLLVVVGAGNFFTAKAIFETRSKKQIENLKELYAAEHKKRGEEYKTHSATVQKLTKDITAQAETIQKQRIIIDKWEKNPLEMYYQQPFSQIAINESALFISPKEVFNGKPDS